MPYRSEDRHRERSRIAARGRRCREAILMDDIKESVPLPRCQLISLDNTSLIRIAVAYIKLRTLLGSKRTVQSKQNSKGHSDVIHEKVILEESAADYLRAIDGFTMLLTGEGEILYASDNINQYTGIPQKDHLGESIYSYIHPCDEGEVKAELGRPPSSTKKQGVCQTFSIRFKCALTSKGNTIKAALRLKAASLYKVMQCTGRSVSFIKERVGGIPGESKRVLVLICEPLINPISSEVPLVDRTSFISHHSVDMKYTHIENYGHSILGYSHHDLIGQSAYHFLHAEDAKDLLSKYRELFNKGQAVLSGYRMLAKHGGYCWIHTQASVIHHPRFGKPQSVVCINTVISGIERETEIFTMTQNEHRKNRNILDAEYKHTPAFKFTKNGLRPTMHLSNNDTSSCQIGIKQAMSLFSKSYLSLQDSKPYLTEALKRVTQCSTVPEDNTNFEKDPLRFKVRCTKPSAEHIYLSPVLMKTKDLTPRLQSPLPPSVEYRSRKRSPLHCAFMADEGSDSKKRRSSTGSSSGATSRCNSLSPPDTPTSPMTNDIMFRSNNCVNNSNSG